MTEQELRDLIIAAFIESIDKRWDGGLISCVLDTAVKVAKERGIIPQEEKFCEHGFISGSYTCSDPYCENAETAPDVDKRCSYTDEETEFRCVLPTGHAQPNIHAFDV